MVNADQFKDMTCNIKIGKKRATVEASSTSEAQTTADGLREGDSKRFKGEENNSLQATEDKTSSNVNEITSPSKVE